MIFCRLFLFFNKFTGINFKTSTMKNSFKMQPTPKMISNVECLDKSKMKKITGGEGATASTIKVINVTNTIVDDMNGLIR